MPFQNAVEARAFVAAVLEEYAAEVFAPAVVAVRIRRAMRYGFLSTQIQQDRALDLRGTQSAKSLTDALRALGYETTWTEVCRVEQGRRTEPPHGHTYPELVIMWHERIFA